MFYTLNVLILLDYNSHFDDGQLNSQYLAALNPAINAVVYCIFC